MDDGDAHKHNNQNRRKTKERKESCNPFISQAIICTSRYIFIMTPIKNIQDNIN